MNHYLAVITLGVLACVAAAPSAQAQSMQELYEKAKLEKELVIYGGGPTSLYEVPAHAFEQKYPGIKVTIHAGFSNVHNERINQQLRTKTLDADLAILQTVQDYVRWKKEGVLAQFKPAAWDSIHGSFKDAEGHYVGVFVTSVSYAYNKDLVKPADAPKSAEDFLKPEFESGPKWGQTCGAVRRRQNKPRSVGAGRFGMQMIIEAHLVDDRRATTPVRLAVIERELTTSPLGLSLAEGKALLASAQRFLVQAQCVGIADVHSSCPLCGAKLSVKGCHSRQLRTVFGRVRAQSLRVRYCGCAGKRAGASFNPLIDLMPTCVTPELEYLQVKWAAHLPYAAATALLGEVLPISDAISVSGTKRRVRAVGAALDQLTEQAPNGAHAGERPALSALAVDSVWLKHCDPPRWQARHVNVVAGRACFEDGRSRLYAYVHNQVPSAAVRLQQFLSASGVGQADRVTVLTDAAGEFEKAVRGCAQPMCRVLDWFHIAMKFRAVEQTLFKHPNLLAPSGRTVQQEVTSSKWLVWHGKANKAVARLKRIHDSFGIVPEQRFWTLHWNLRHTFWYLRSNGRYLVNYARRYRKGLPISSSIAESAINQVVSLRMAKKRQMRWSDEGAHLLVQVRVHDINGTLRPRAVPIPLRPPKPQHQPKWDAYLLREAA